MEKGECEYFTVLVLLVGVLSQTALAGGIDNKQNWSARYIATGSRNAATDGPDIAAYNPAGIMFQADGIGLGLDVQYIWKNYDQTYTKFPEMSSVDRDQDEPSIVPGLFATYKSGNWGYLALSQTAAAVAKSNMNPAIPSPMKSGHLYILIRARGLEAPCSLMKRLSRLLLYHLYRGGLLSVQRDVFRGRRRPVCGCQQDSKSLCRHHLAFGCCLRRL